MWDLNHGGGLELMFTSFYGVSMVPGVNLQSKQNIQVVQEQMWS
jgi:hypothetical protein